MDLEASVDFTTTILGNTYVPTTNSSEPKPNNRISKSYSESELNQKCNRDPLSVSTPNLFGKV